MDDSRRRLFTRLLVIAMIASALWGGWMIAKNDGRRGRIGRPPKSEKPPVKDTQIFHKDRFKIFLAWDNRPPQPLV
jgi:hypothetical protein